MSKFIRFTEEFLQRVRRDVPLLPFVAGEVELKRAGHDYLGCCPFHTEKTPSFRVLTQKNTYRCYGCNERGDAIEWVRRRQHLTFPDAVRHVATAGGISLPASDEDDDAREKRQRLSAVYEALKHARHLYKLGLEESNVARAYLRDTRGLTPETIHRFGLGVVGRGVLELLQKHASDETLLAAGLVAQGEGGALFDRFRHRVMVPIVNESGNLVGFAGRSLLEHPDRTPKYVNCPETEVFHKGRELFGLYLAKPKIRSSRTAVVVEGYFDVLSLHQTGEERAVAPMGTALTDMQVRRLLVHADHVVFAFDGDTAGRRAAIAAAQVLLQEMSDGVTAKVLLFPEGQDPDSFVRQHGYSGWTGALDGAVPLSKFLSDVVSEGLDRSLPESQVAAAERATRVLERIQHATNFRTALRAKFESVIGITFAEERPAAPPKERTCLRMR